MKVLQLVDSPDGGGAQRLVRELTERLPEFGSDARAVYFCNPREVRLSSRETLPLLKRYFRKLIDEGEPFIVHSHLTWPLYYTALASGGGQDVPLVYTEHSTHNSRRDRLWLLPLERWAYRRYQRIICISEGTKVALSEWLGDELISGRSQTIMNGSRMLAMRESHKECARACRLVSIGALSSHKGFDTALRAVAQLGDKVARYTILGEGPERGRLEQLVNDLGLKETVRLPGYCDDITPYLHEADLGIVPSHWEGFGLTAVEALSTGLPIVASDVMGMREVLEDCPAVILVAPLDASSFADGIRYAVEHLVGRVDIAKAARKHSEGFGIESMVERYAAMYNQVFEDTVRNK